MAPTVCGEHPKRRQHSIGAARTARPQTGKCIPHPKHKPPKQQCRTQQGAQNDGPHHQPSLANSVSGPNLIKHAKERTNCAKHIYVNAKRKKASGKRLQTLHVHTVANTVWQSFVTLWYQV
jgi:hypothetical protein